MMKPTRAIINDTSKAELYLADCFEVLPHLEDDSVDLIIMDLPYGTTKNDWDKPLQLNDYIEVNNKKYEKDDYAEFLVDNYLAAELSRLSMKEISSQWTMLWKNEVRKGLWSQLLRVMKKNAAILCFAQEPFASSLIQSNKNMFRYEWILEKTAATGFFNAKSMPLKAHEKLLVFYNNLPTYNPQMTTGHKPVNAYTKKGDHSSNYNSSQSVISGGGSTTRYPRSVLTMKMDKQKSSIHPTQKPVNTLRYFLRTYSGPNQVVLDPTAGSLSLGVACLLENRHFIGIEKDETYFNKGIERIDEMNGGNDDENNS